MGQKHVQVLGLSPIKLFYERPFLKNDILVNEVTERALIQVRSLVQLQRILSALRKTEPGATLPSELLFYSGTLVLIKALDTQDINTPWWKSPYMVVFSTPSTVKVPRRDSWIHHTRVKLWTASECHNDNIPLDHHQATSEPTLHL